MNIRVKAALVTAGILSTTIISVLAIQLAINYLTIDQIMTLIGAGFFGFFIYILYGITLNRLEYEQKVKEIAGKSNT